MRGRANDNRATVELKLILPYITRNGARNSFDKLIAEISAGASENALAKLQANIFKRGFLSDGGTTQPLSRDILKWIVSKEGHPSKQVKKAARDF